MSRFYLSILTAFILLAWTACQSRPDYVIEEDEMIDLLTDVHLAEGLIDVQQKQNRDDAHYGQQVIAAVLDKHHISKAQYDTSLVWYSEHLNTLIRVYNHVNKNLAAKHDEWEEAAAHAVNTWQYASGDSVNLWSKRSYCIMDEGQLSHRNIWTMQTDTTFRAGDSIQWSMHLPEVADGEALIASLTLVKKEYPAAVIQVIEGATTSFLQSDTLICLTCAADADTKIEQIIATLNLIRTNGKNTALKPCVVDDIKMLRLHRKPQKK